ncbi:TolC family outer membrane protein [Rehaibacterium terrae]|jgi:outer membrane protein|uniref:Outer membrane protein n=1 Tax=Rehaibacterium terrae TaxID=1341696 RepID=A0A7W8DCZ9_9GAMM|nr:TolC family outer membrane protein [Rehaibacterium terrae]MBB5014822.1 outer membrane protein [Rehaibacterium terrae]
MRFRLRPLSLAILLGTVAGTAGAADLMQAYDLARQSDPQLAAAESQMLSQREGVNISRASLLPQIDGEASLSDFEGDSSGISARPNPDGTVGFGPSSGSSDDRTRSYTLTLRQSIYNHGNYTGLRASRARADRAAADYEAANHALMVRVAEAYFNVLTAIETLASARAEERAVKRQLDQAEKRLEVGLSPITDVHEARARHDSARAAAISAETALDDAREALAEITGRALYGLKGLGPDFRPTAPTPEDAEAWVKLALGQNPALRSRLLALQAADHDIGTARAGHLPTLSASVRRFDTATWGETTSNTVTFPSTSARDNTTVGLTLTVPLFAGGATQARVRQAIHSRDAIADQYEQEQRAVIRQTRNAYRSLLAGLSEIDARQQALVSARSALEATEAGFEVGTRTIVDVLISQQQLYQAQREYARARHGFLVNGLRLKQAAGNIEIGDVQSVNRLLVADAEAALDTVTE